MTAAPLEGLKVVEISNIVAGPMTGMMLAELGADVIKVESPSAPDPMRAGGGMSPDDVTGFFYAVNRGKRFCSIDAKQPAGQEILVEMAAGADIFLHNIRPGKAEGIGVGYDELAAINPELIYCAISGMGTEGPESHLPVFDYALQAKIGMVDYQRDLKTGKSDLVHQLLIDKATAHTALEAILAALYLRSRTGAGQRIDIPMVAAGLAFFWPDGMSAAHAEVNPAVPADKLPPFLEAAPGSMLGVFSTTDGEVTIGILVPPWDGLCLSLDRLDWLTDERFAEASGRIMNLPALIDELAGEIGKYTTVEVLERFARFDVASGPVTSRRDVHKDQTIQHLGLLSEQEADGIGLVRQPAPPWNFGAASTEITSSIGRTGSDSVEILAEFGRTPDEIAQLQKEGIVNVAVVSDAPA